MTVWNDTKSETKTPWGSTEPPKESEVRQFGRDKMHHPQGGGQTNEEIQERREQESQKPIDTLSRTKEDVKSEEQRKEYKNAFLAEKARELKQTLGGTADEIIARTQRFLNEGKTKVENLSQGSTFFNKQTGKWEIGGDVQSSQGFKTLAQEKYNELKQLRETANVFFTQNEQGQWEPKEFKDVVAEHYNKLDGDSRMAVDSKVNKLMGLAEKINRLEQLGQSNSAEAQGLRRQLELADTDGVVSGLYDAKKSVEDLLSGNISFYGDEGAEAKSMGDILNLNLQEIESELEKAAAMSSGLFGGDYSAAIARSLDKDSEDYQKFMQEEKAFKNTLNEAGSSYFRELQGNLSKMAREIQSGLKGIAPDLQNAMGEALGDYGKVAEGWFAALSEGDSDDFVGAMQDLIFDPDSGLMITERAQLARLIGDVLKKQGVDIGMDLEGDALLSNAMYELEQTGQFSWVNEDGTKVTLTPSGGQKAQIMYAAKQGQDALKKAFKGIVDGTGMDVSKVVRDVIDSPSYRGMGMVIDSFKDSVMDSFKSLKGSDTEKLLISKVLGDDAAIRQKFNNGELSEAEVNGLMLEYIKNNPKIAQDMLMSDWGNRAKDFETQSKEINREIEINSKVVAANQSKIAEHEKAIQDRMATVQNWPIDTTNKILDDIDLNTKLAVEAFNDRGFADALMFEKGLPIEQANARINSASKALGAIEGLHKIREQDPELFGSIISAVNAAIRGRQGMRGYQQLSTLDLPSMEASYRNQLMVSLLTDNSGGDIYTIISHAIGKGIQSHPKISEAKKELDSLNNKLNDTKAGNEKALADMEKQKAVMAELSKEMKMSENIFTPKDITKAAANIANSLIKEGISPVRQEGLGLGGDGQRGKVMAPMNAMGQIADYTPTQIEGQSFTPNAVSGAKDKIGGYTGEVKGPVIDERNFDQISDIVTSEQAAADPKGYPTWNVNSTAGSATINTPNGPVKGHMAVDSKGNRVFVADVSSMDRNSVMKAIAGLGQLAKDSKNPTPNNILDNLWNKAMDIARKGTDLLAPPPNAKDIDLLEWSGVDTKDYSPAQTAQAMNNLEIENKEYLRRMGYSDDDISKMSRKDIITRGQVAKDHYADEQDKKIDEAEGAGKITPEQAESIKSQGIQNPETIDRQIEDAKKSNSNNTQPLNQGGKDRTQQYSEDWDEPSEPTPAPAPVKKEDTSVRDRLNEEDKRKFGPNAAMRE